MENLIQPIAWMNLLYASLMFGGFIVFMLLGTLVLPGLQHQRKVISDNELKIYKLNGLVLFLVTSVSVLFLTFTSTFTLAPLITFFWSLFLVANLVACCWATILYVSGKQQQKPDEPGKPVGQLLADFWLGVELNPTWMNVDLKMFAYQPSLIGLGLMNAAFAYIQYQKYGYLTPQMSLFQGFWWFYLFSHYYYEEFMLSTWDIIAEKFGFMLIWGDLVLVPFFYSITGWYLVDRIEPWSIGRLTAIALLYTLGLILFRGANAQKHRFKKNAQTKIWGQSAQTLQQHGQQLLISGWWGIGRKLNYTGEICVYFAIALTSGFHSFVPYLLPLWLSSLLIHRAWRDEQRCQTKYGHLWQAYCDRVRFRMIPFLY